MASTATCGSPPHPSRPPPLFPPGGRRERDMGKRIREAAWSKSMNSFTSTFDGDSVDSSLLLLAELGVVDCSDPMYIATVERIGNTLRRGAFLARYAEPDD